MKLVRFILIQSVLLLSTSFFLDARYHKISRIQELDKLVDSYEYSVVCFASAGSLSGEDLDFDERKYRKKSFRTVEDILRSISKSYDYKNFLSKDVGFVAVDVAGKYGDDVIAQYGLVQMPSCFIFDQGENTGQKVIRPTSSKDLTRLLERVAGNDLKSLLAQRKADASQERQERIAMYYSYGGPYRYGWRYGYYGPYGYGPYGYGFYGYGPYAGWYGCW
jgi:hypothetical protein